MLGSYVSRIVQGVLSAAPGALRQVPPMLLGAVITDAAGKLRVRLLLTVGAQVLPLAILASDSLATKTYRRQTMQDHQLALGNLHFASRRGGIGGGAHGHDQSGRHNPQG